MELFARRDLYMYLVVLALLLPLPAAAQTVGKLYVTCPANKTVQSSNGSAVAVSYSATTEGGVAPVTVSGTPASGSLFPVGTTTVHVNARSSDGQSCLVQLYDDGHVDDVDRRHALRNMSGKQDRAVVEWFRGGGDLQCDH